MSVVEPEVSFGPSVGSTSETADATTWTNWSAATNAEGQGVVEVCEECQADMEEEEDRLYEEMMSRQERE